MYVERRGTRNGNPERVGMVKGERKRKESEKVLGRWVYIGGGLGRAISKAARVRGRSLQCFLRASLGKGRWTSRLNTYALGVFQTWIATLRAHREI